MADERIECRGYVDVYRSRWVAHRFSAESLAILRLGGSVRAFGRPTDVLDPETGDYTLGLPPQEGAEPACWVRATGEEIDGRLCLEVRFEPFATSPRAL